MNKSSTRSSYLTVSAELSPQNNDYLYYCEGRGMKSFSLIIFIIVKREERRASL